MKQQALIQEIERFCGQVDLSFVDRCAAIADITAKLATDQLLEHLDEAGIIPERFDHDSTEEKVFAKYCDALLARSLAELGMASTLIEERADAADVEAGFDSYRIVGDAKAFRLSRTAKNQKDFKVEALNQWRKGANYACLLSPLYQYPTSNSQIYQQARSYNVTMLSYTHLAFLIRHQADPSKLRRLWEAPQNAPAGKSAKAYWRTIGDVVSEITGTAPKDWDRAVEQASALLPRQADEQIAFWEARKAQIHTLSPEAARAELIAALKIDSKVAVIRSAVAELRESTETFEM